MKSELRQASRKLRRGTPHPQSKYRGLTPERKQRLLTLLRKSLTNKKKKSVKAKRAECKRYDLVYDRNTKKCRESRRPKKSKGSRSAATKRKRAACKSRLGDHYTYDEKLEKRTPGTKGCRVKCGGKTKVNEMRSGCVSRSKKK